MAAWSVYEIYDAYVEEGPEAALKQLGYEIVLTYTGAKVVKFAGKIIAPTVAAGWKRALSKNTVLNLLVGKSVDAGKKAVSKIQKVYTAADKAIAKILKGKAVAGKSVPTVSQDATSAVAKIKLQKKLANEAQKSESGTVMAGPGAKKTFIDKYRVAKIYGGHPDDWVKKSSTSYIASDGIKMETHWVENIKTGEKIEHKIKEIFIKTKDIF